jgi:fatty-acyl-CoA synthase
MKLAFSTLGCPDWSWDEIITVAKDLGFDGVGVRGIGRELNVPDALVFDEKHIEVTKANLDRLGIEISCLVSGCNIFKDDHTVVENAKSWIDLAQKTGTSYVRLLADEAPQEKGAIDMQVVENNLLMLSDYAENKKVVLLVETNGVFADSNVMKKLMNQINRENVGVLWDSHHPYRYKNESFIETYEILSPWIKYIQVKDSIMLDGKTKYKRFGQGDLPLESLVQMLCDNGYDGYMSLEWVKRWDNELEDAGIALPEYKYVASYMINKYTSTPEAGDNMWDITLGQLVEQMAQDYPDNPAIIYGDQNYTRTYKEFNDECDEVAKGLLAMGVNKGDHVAIWATNYPEWIITQFATAKIGAVLVTVNTNYKKFEMEYLLRQSESSTLILMEGFKDTNYAAIINELVPELKDCKKGYLSSEKFPYLKRVIYLNDKHYDGMYNWKEIYGYSAITSDSELNRIKDSLDPHDTINIQYTSGTTGFPKGVMLSHYNVLNNGKNIGDCLDFTTEDRLCIPVPLFHCFGCVLGVLACVTHGATMVPVDHYNPVKVMHAISEYKCTALHGVPTMFIGILENNDFDKFDFSSLRTGIMAGSPCPEKVMREVIQKMHMKDITIAYGQTEAAPVCTQTKTDDSVEKRVTTVGQALPFVECKIVDPETNQEVAVGVQGEFVARGYNIMKGYYNMPEATSLAIDKDGWLHTGDLSTMDEEGYFKITGRIKDMIIRGGENIYPKEIEEFLYTVDCISDVQVAGVPDKQYGEQVGAFIVLKEGVDCSEQEIKDAVRANMARHKVPKYVFFVDGYPMTASGKIQKFKLRDMAIELAGLNKDDLDATV